MDTNAEPRTILRIKRKRNEEPLDALGMFSDSFNDYQNLELPIVIESGIRRKKSRGPLDVFQFAQTVDDTTWKDESRRKAIQVSGICALNKHGRFEFVGSDNFVVARTV